MSWDAVTPVLAFLALSALATDRLQTQHWIEGTASNPLATPAGGFVYEANPVLAGRPWMLDPYFDFLEGVTEAMPRMLSPPWSVPVQALWAAAAIANVARNNDLAREQGLPRYWMLAYRCRF